MKEKIEQFLRMGFEHCFDTEVWKETKRLILDENFCLEMDDKKGTLYIDFIELRFLGKFENDFFYDSVLETFCFDETDHYNEKDFADYFVKSIEKFREQEQAQNTLNAWENYEGIS